MRPNLPFLSVASNAILKPNGLLRWKKRLVKDARLSLPLTEVMKIARLLSPLPDVLGLSSPRHGRRLALLSRQSLTLIIIMNCNTPDDWAIDGDSDPAHSAMLPNSS